MVQLVKSNYKKKQSIEEKQRARKKPKRFKATNLVEEKPD